MSSPRRSGDTLAGKIDKENKRVVLPEVKWADRAADKKIFITACGTAITPVW